MNAGPPDVVDQPLADDVDHRVVAVAQRLSSAADALGIAGNTAGDLGELLRLVLAAVRADPSPGSLWLLWTTLSGAYPESDDVVEARRHLQSPDTTGGEVRLLDATLAAAGRAGTPVEPTELIVDQVLVDVDFSARHDLHTGIQRVVRSFVPHWVAEHPDVIPVVWHPGHGAYRRLDAVERHRVLHWGTPRTTGTETPEAAAADRTLLLPERCVVVLPEVPSVAACHRLAAMARSSSNTVAIVGHDCIPVVSADRLPLAEPNRFVQFLTVVKHADRLAAVSESAAEEFRGFGDMLVAQGLRGPDVVTCAEPVAIPVSVAAPDTPRPLVVCVGSFEPRKNQMAVLFAAEMLWREGLQFDLRLIGGGAPSGSFKRRATQLARTRPLSVEVAVSEERLEDSYRDASFVVFPSLHEGYGLPVAEALGHGTPVLTSDLGSMAELARGGGALTVDPHDDDAVLGSMRRMLTEPGLLDRLRSEIPHRPRTTWEDYAATLWSTLVEPVRATSWPKAAEAR